MTTPSRKDPRLRFALALVRKLDRPPDLPTVLEQSMHRLQTRMSLVQSTWRLLRRAQDRNWPAAMRRLHGQLTDPLHELCYASDLALRGSREPLIGPAPSLRPVYLDLVALDDEFDEVTIDGKTLSVVTDPIVLDDVPLGRFRIELDLSRLHLSHPATAVRTVALDPDPAGTDESVTHPHVRDDVPCLGDATEPVRQAILDGRLLDLFQLVDRVLQTYNDGSAYVQLEDWHGRPCEDCGRTVSTDDASFCQSCNHDLCPRCTMACDRCGDAFCSTCLTHHHEELFCQTCLEHVQEDEEEDNDDQPDQAEAA